MTATEKRKAVKAKYSEIIGRNKYSQSKRDYCFKKASDGNFYSDCSSSVSYAYKEAGYGFGILNTVGMYNCKKFTQVPVIIEKGQIKNSEILRIGDMLLYAGSDSGRASSGYVGHVEMYCGYDSNGVHWLYGHGSGTPKKTKMTDKNKSRYASKTSTKLGHKGLIRVMRFIQDDDYVAPTAPTVQTTGKKVKVVNGTWNIRKGASTNHSIVTTVKSGMVLEVVSMTDSWVKIKASNTVGWISKKGVVEV